MNHIIYIFLDSKSNILFVGNAEKPLETVINGHHLSKTVFIDVGRVVFSEWRYDASSEIINFLRPKYNKHLTNDKFMLRTKFLEDFLGTPWHNYGDRDKAIAKVEWMNVSNLLFLKGICNNDSNSLDYLKDQFLFHGIELFMEWLDPMIDILDQN